MRSPIVGMAAGRFQTALRIHSELSMVADNSGSLPDLPGVMVHDVLVTRLPSELPEEDVTFRQSANTKYIKHY